MKTLHEIEIKSTTDSNYQVKITLSKDDKNATHVIKIHSTENGKPWTWQDDEYEYSVALKEFMDLVGEYAKHTVLMNF